MTRAWALCTHAAVVAVGGTGLVYAWMRYLCAPADEFALTNHPAEPAWQAAHLLSAPLLLLLLGWLGAVHVAPRLRSVGGPRRGTGWLLVVLAPLMVFSGYGLQVAVGEALRVFCVWLHAISSGLWLLVYGLHLTGGRLPESDLEDWSPSLVAQGLDGIHAGGAPSGVDAEHDADDGGDAERHHRVLDQDERAQ